MSDLLNMSFDGGMPSLSGTWIDNISGKKINVLDTFIDDGGLQVKTTTGLISGNYFSNHYTQVAELTPEEIKAEEEQLKVNKALEEKLNKDLEETKSDPKVLLDGLEGAEDKFAKYDLPGPQETPKTHMLKKVFKDTEFNIECELSVKDFPKTAVQTLKDFFDITDEDIVNYIIPLVKPNKEKLKKSIKALM
jgi:hypothetical protein